MPINGRTWYDIFKKEPETTTSADPENMLVSVEFVLDRDVSYHNRSIYTSLDLLGDVGGLFDALKGIMSFVVSIFFMIFGNPLDEYLLKSVFKENPKKESSPKSQEYILQETQNMAILP